MLKVRTLFENHKVYYDHKGYALVCINGAETKLHILIWERKNGKKPSGYYIHHKDLDKGNYNLNNLELLTQPDHFKVHAGWVKTDGEWSHKPCTGCNKLLPLTDFYERVTANTPTALCKECHCLKTHSRVSSDESLAKRKEWKRNYDRLPQNKEKAKKHRIAVKMLKRSDASC